MRLFRKQVFSLLAVLPTLAVIPCYADVYVFVDSKGVRHISNVPDDPRYRLIMRTPKYRKPSNFAAGNSPKDKGWELIQPSAAAKAQGFKWSSRRATIPFKINETNRQRFIRDIAVIAGQHRLEPELLHAVISAESAFNPKAVSHAGAMGLMQLMPATAARFGVNNPFDPVANMRGGARYLRWLLDRFKSLKLAIAAYNAGEGAVERYGNAIPPFKETQTYVARVLEFYNYYRHIN